MSGKIYKIGDFLIRQKKTIVLDDKVEYKRLTIKMYGKGVLLRDKEFGLNIGTKKQFTVKSGQFILSKIDARNGAFGVIPNICDGGIITGNFWSYEINENIVNIDWFNLFVSTDNFIDVCTNSSSGATNRKYLNENIFLDYKIFIPNIDEQKSLITNFLNNRNNYDKLQNINTQNQNYIKLLKQSILQEAIEGKLTKSWREKNKDIEPASVLLEKIKAEKDELIKQKKLKKQKELNPVLGNEIIFKIPNNNIICRLGDIIQVNPRNKLEDNIDTSFIPMKLIKDGFVNKHISEKRKWKEIKTGFTHFKENDVVFAKITPCFQNRKSAVMKDLINGYGAGTTELIVLRSFNKTILPELLLYFVKSKSFIDLGVSTYTGTAGQQRVDREKLLNIPFLLPPLDEQKEIVKKVDELMKFCDELEKQTLEAKESSENLMKAVLGEVFSK